MQSKVVFCFSLHMVFEFGDCFLFTFLPEQISAPWENAVLKDGFCQATLNKSKQQLFPPKKRSGFEGFIDEGVCNIT